MKRIFIFCFLFLGLVLLNTGNVQAQSCFTGANWEGPSGNPPDDNRTKPLYSSCGETQVISPAGSEPFLVQFGGTPSQVYTNNADGNNIRIQDTVENPELQLQYGTGANDHWAIYNNQSGDALRFWANGSDKVTILSNGFVGIGEMSPDAELFVKGQLKLSNGTEADGYVLTTNAVGLSSWADLDTLGAGNWTLNGTTIHPDTLTWDVAIGSDSMVGSERLRVSGNILAYDPNASIIAQDSSDNNDWAFIGRGNSGSDFLTISPRGTDGAVQFYSNAGWDLALMNGDVGIKTSSPNIDLAIGDTDTGLEQTSNGNLSFLSNNATKFSISPSGFVASDDVRFNMDSNRNIRFYPGGGSDEYFYGDNDYDLMYRSNAGDMLTLFNSDSENNVNPPNQGFPIKFHKNTDFDDAINVDDQICLRGECVTDWDNVSIYWSMNGSDLYPQQTSWDVGIGTTNPDGSYKLDVNGDIKFNDRIRSYDNSAFPNIVLDSTSSGDNWTSQGAMISLGESASATGTAALYLTYVGNGYSYIGMGGLNSSGVPNDSYLRFDYDDKDIYTDSNLQINNAGIHVGGTSDPGDDNIIVDGKIAVGGGYSIDPIYYVTTPGMYGQTGEFTNLCLGGGTGANCITSWDDIVTAGGGGYWDLNGTDLYVENTGYDIGIGTNSPGHRLTVSGGNLSLEDNFLYNTRAIQLKDWDDNSGGEDDKYRLLGRDGSWMFYNGGVVVGNYSNGTWSDLGDGYLVVENRVGIGTTNPAYSLSVNGDIDMIKGQSSRIHSLGEISLDWTTGGSYDNPQYHGIQSKNESASWSDDIRINSYNSIVTTLDSNNNNPTSDFKIQHHSSTDGTDLFVVSSPNGDMTVAGQSMFGSATEVVASGQNLLYGNVDSSSVGNLLLLQNESSDVFKITTSGSAGGSLTVQDGPSTPNPANAGKIPILDSSGLIDPDLLPFEPGDVITEAHRSLIDGLGAYTTDNFNISKLDIDDSLATAGEVCLGIKFGPKEEIIGTANCASPLDDVDSDGFLTCVRPHGNDCNDKNFYVRRDGAFWGYVDEDTSGSDVSIQPASWLECNASWSAVPGDYNCDNVVDKIWSPEGGATPLLTTDVLYRDEPGGCMSKGLASSHSCDESQAEIHCDPNGEDGPPCYKNSPSCDEEDLLSKGWYTVKCR